MKLVFSAWSLSSKARCFIPSTECGPSLLYSLEPYQEKKLVVLHIDVNDTNRPLSSPIETYVLTAQEHSSSSLYYRAEFYFKK